MLTHSSIIKTLQKQTNLTYLLGNEDSTEEIAQVELSLFIDTQELCEKLCTVKSNLSIVSLNAQSIRAKFDEFQIAINEISKKHHVSIICIQESWLSSECCTKMFELPDYQLIAKGNIVLTTEGCFFMFIMITPVNLLP